MLLASALLASAPLAAEVATHQYAIRVNDDLSRLHVEARFAQPVDRIRVRSRQAEGYLIDAEDCADGRALRARGRRLSLPAGGIECLRYTVDMDRAAADERNNSVMTAGTRMVSPSRWLWRPSISADTALRVRFDLPPAIGIALPWRPLGDSGDDYLLQTSPQSGNAPAVFGKFDTHSVDVAGARLRVVVPSRNGRPALATATLLPWIEAAARDVSLAYGRFPNASPFVVVVPTGGSRRRGNSPVPFGRVIRDGGEAVELFVDPSQPLSKFLEDWTTTHEFSHMMTPYLDSGARWISEGLAQYYQNVLMARSGVYDQAMAWQKIHTGLERGRQSQPSMSPNEAARQGVRAARMKVYWSGAALALMADVTLRERSDGKETLDSVLGKLQACCLPSDRSWTGVEFLQKLDALLEPQAGAERAEPVFMPLYERYADTAGFPDFGDYFASLGIDVGGRDIRISDDAPLAAVRRQITQVDEDAARWRRSLLEN